MLEKTPWHNFIGRYGYKKLKWDEDMEIDVNYMNLINMNYELMTMNWTIHTISERQFVFTTLWAILGIKVVACQKTQATKFINQPFKTFFDL